jgi:hypothetical protein
MKKILAMSKANFDESFVNKHTMPNLYILKRLHALTNSL